jgi:hypothetical protein
MDFGKITDQGCYTTGLKRFPKGDLCMRRQSSKARVDHIMGPRAVPVKKKWKSEKDFQLYRRKRIKHMAEQDEQDHCEGVTCPSLLENLEKDRAAPIFSRGVWRRHFAFDVGLTFSSGNSALAYFLQSLCIQNNRSASERGNCGCWIAM